MDFIGLYVLPLCFAVLNVQNGTFFKVNCKGFTSEDTEKKVDIIGEYGFGFYNDTAAILCCGIFVLIYVLMQGVFFTVVAVAVVMVEIHVIAMRLQFNAVLLCPWMCTCGWLLWSEG